MPYSSYFLRSDLFKRALLEGEIPELQIRGREGKNLLVKRLEKMRALRRSARWNDHWTKVAAASPRRPSF